MASSADGTKLVAAERGGQLHVTSPQTTRGPAGSLSGGPFDALELVHLGGGVFNVVSSGGQQFASQ